MSNFAFLQAEFPVVFDAARQAEAHAHGDPRAACFYARRALELALAWLFRHDPALRLPYQDHLAALIREPTFHLTEQGVVEAKRLYESPFTDVSPAGPEALFSGAAVEKIVDVLRDVQAKAA